MQLRYSVLRMLQRASDHSRRPQSFAASGSSVVSSASHNREAAEDARQLSATGRSAVCSTSAYASSEAATTGKHACGWETSRAMVSFGRVGKTRHTSCSQSLDSPFDLPLAFPVAPVAPPEHQIEPDVAPGSPRAAISPKPRPASGDRQSLLGQARPALGGLLLSPHEGAPSPQGRGRRPRAAGAPASPRGARAPSPRRPPPASRGIPACCRPDWPQQRYYQT